jgi:hypothetical protein
VKTSGPDGPADQTGRTAATTTDWNDLTEDQKDAINEAAYANCADRLRRADAP